MMMMSLWRDEMVSVHRPDLPICKVQTCRLVSSESRHRQTFLELWFHLDVSESYMKDVWIHRLHQEIFGLVVRQKRSARSNRLRAPYESDLTFLDDQFSRPLFGLLYLHHLCTSFHRPQYILYSCFVCYFLELFSYFYVSFSRRSTVRLRSKIYIYIERNAKKQFNLYLSHKCCFLFSHNCCSIYSSFPPRKENLKSKIRK